MKIRIRTLYILFMVILLATEFYYIDAFGGALRIYHFLTPLVIISLYRYIPRLSVTGLFWFLSGFLTVNLLSALFADLPSEAFKSIGLLVANMSISFAVALILISNQLNMEQVIRIALGVALAGIILGITQVLIFRLSGQNLGLSESQQLQVAAGFASGLRTEANTFAKNLNVIFLLSLPTILADKKRSSLLTAYVLIIGMMLSFTRSALYGLLITLFLYCLWSLSSGRGKLLSKRPVIFASVVGMLLVVFISISGQFNEYATHKVTNFFNSEEVLEGESAGFRLMSQGLLLSAFLENGKTMLVGTGWGQVRFSAFDREWQAGGGELISALGYGGIFGGFFYIMYQASAIRALNRLARFQMLSPEYKIFEGLLLALVGVLVTGQINGSFLAPEYWMLYGMAMACAYQYRDYFIKNKIKER